MGNLVAGFDMVNFEDQSPPILDFAEEIIKSQVPCIMHCGETHDRDSKNTVDALLLGSGRLGHAF